MNMKSSPRIVAGPQAQNVAQAWHPGDLELEDTRPWSMDVATLYDLFAPHPENRDNRKITRMVWQPVEAIQQEAVEDPSAPLPASEAPKALDPAPEVPDPQAQAGEAVAEILDQARSQADQMILEAQRTIDAMFQDAQKELEEEKRAEREKGRAEAQAEAATLLQSLQTAIQHVHEWKEDLFRQSEPIILDMVKDIAHKVFGDGLTLDDLALQANLNRVLEDSASLGDIQIYLNPEDAALLDPAWRETRAAITGEKIQILPSEGIKRGGCFVNGQMGSIDARVETQMQAVFDAISSTQEEEETHA